MTSGGPFVIELPWPSPALNPNGRAHWAAKAKEAKLAKATAFYAAKSICPSKLNWSGVRIFWEFHPKTANMPDGDNLVASCKNFQDGIALAIGIDDSKFKTDYRISSPIKGGLVRVTISKIGDEE